MHARLLQVFNNESGETFRFIFESASAEEDALDAESIELTDAHRADLPAKAVIVNRVALAEPHVGMRWLVSLTLEAPCAFPLALFYDGKELCKVSLKEYDAICLKRDVAMVNPAIDDCYCDWKKAQADKASKQQPRKPKIDPLMSIVTPLFHTPPNFLRELLDSIVVQTYENWELVLVNASPDDKEMQQVLASYADPRIKVIEMERNLGIAGNTNAGIAVTSGDYVSFIDHDDVVEPTLLMEYVLFIQDHPNVGLLYCDEDNFELSVDESFAPMFKPKLNRDLLYTHNYVVHCLTVSRKVLDATERSSDETNGAQDWDLTLKALEQGIEFGRVPKILYHWRQHEGSTNGGKKEAKPYADAGSIFTLDEHFRHEGIDASVSKTYIPHLYRSHFRASINEPYLMIVIAHDAAKLQQLSDTFSSVEGASFAKVVVVSNAPDIDESAEVFGACVSCEFIQANEGLWQTVNDAIRSHSQANILLCTDEIQWADQDALLELAGYLSRKDVGVVAPQALFSDGLLSHAGLCIDEAGDVRFINQNLPQGSGGGYWGLAECSANYSAVFADCMMFTKDAYDATEGFRDYGDDLVTAVDFCFQMRATGLNVICTPNAHVMVDLLIQGVSEEANARREKALLALWKAWGEEWKRDVLWNPNIKLKTGYPHLAVPRLSFFERVGRKIRRTLRK